MVGICVVIPESLANYDITVFSGLTLAWSITEVIRYGFYVIKMFGIATILVGMVKVQCFLGIISTWLSM